MAIGFAELQFIEPLFEFLDAQQQPAILAEQLPAEPAPISDDEAGERDGRE